MHHSIGRNVEIQRRLSMLKCPNCDSMLQANGSLTCEKCGVDFCNNPHGIIDLTPINLSETKQKISVFWSDIYKQWYGSEVSSLTDLNNALALLENLFRKRQHLAVTEMDLDKLDKRELLEVGCGAGGHSALFASYGARVTAIDITADRVNSANRKLDLLREGNSEAGLALCADAETLPFSDDVFDMVYSNGVLHHTENIAAAVQEVFRVLRPGGEGIIMLYSRHSACFWFRLFPKAILSGLLFRLPEEQWLGKLTEGRPQYHQEYNPRTRVFSKQQLISMFEQFEIVSLRKNSFSISNLPIPGLSASRERLLSTIGYKAHEGGLLVYGEPIIPETSIEQFIGSVLGWCWNIRLRKPSHGTRAIHAVERCEPKTLQAP